MHVPSMHYPMLRSIGYYVPVEYSVFSIVYITHPGNEVRCQDSTVEPVRQEIQTRIHTLSSTVMDSNDRIALVYQLSSGSDTVFAMDVPQSSDLGSVYEEEAAIDSSNTCTPDLPPRTEEMYLTTDGSLALAGALVPYLLHYVLLNVLVKTYTIK